MDVQIILSTLIGLLPSVMAIVLLILIRKSGRKLIRVKSFETIPYAALSLICFVGFIYLLFFSVDEGHGFYAVSIFLMGVYMISHSLISRSIIREKGIIILNPYPSLLKWADVDSFGVYGRKIYLKKNKRYLSIIGTDGDIEDIVKVISEKKYSVHVFHE